MIKQVHAGSNAGAPVARAYAYTADDERLLTVSGPFEYEFTLRDLDGKVLREIKSDPATETWSVTLDNIWMDGRLVGFVDNGSEVHAHTDHLGTPRLHTDANGAEVSRHDYFPFGEEIPPAGQSLIPMKFTGHERDASTIGPAAELDYMHARYYSPWWGRFLSVDKATIVDPRSPQSWSRYAYAGSNPVKLVDRTGLYEEDFHFDTTRVLALAAGFSAARSDSIARATQALDEDSRGPILANKNMVPNHQAFHFVSNEQLDGLFGSLALLAGTSMADQAAGTFLHALQDSFSHQGFSPGLGHSFSLTGPDDPSNNPQKALAAANASFDTLAWLSSLSGGQEQSSFKAIAPGLRAAFSTDKKEVRKALLQKLYRKLLKERLDRARASNESAPPL